MQDLDAFENDLIDDFRQHPVLADVTALSDDEFTAVLLQRRFVSLAFTPAYDLAIDLLRDEAILRTARVILREEYPDSRGYTRSHREDMKEDILALGVSWQQFVTTRPTPQTLATIAATMSLIAAAGADEHADLKLLTILRFWGEVLVSVEYEQLWPRMAPRLTSNGENRSRFYYPHYIHDAKSQPVATSSPLASTHSDRMGVRLAELLVDEQRRVTFKAVETEILQLKRGFYDQFRPPAEAARQADRAVAPAAG